MKRNKNQIEILLANLAVYSRIKMEGLYDTDVTEKTIQYFQDVIAHPKLDSILAMFPDKLYAKTTNLKDILNGNFNLQQIGGIVDIKNLETIRDSFFKKHGIVWDNNKYKLPNGKLLTWNNVIDNGDWDFLIEYGNFRKEMVDKILEKSLSESQCGDVCSHQAVGSVNPTSDYDLTVSGPKAPKIVELFNQLFRTIFKEESNKFFDTNVYGASFFEPVDFNYKTFTVVPYKKKNKVHYIKTLINHDHEKNIIKEQRQWAIIKLLSHLKSEKRILKLIKNNRLKQHFLSAIKKKKKLDIVNNRPLDRSDDRVMNDLYVKNLYTSEKLERELEQNYNSDIKNEYLDAISQANYYGNETYFTQGAFYHIVGKQQSDITLPISKNEYLDSYIENIGDVLKDVHHIKHTSTNCMELVIKMSKYYYRAYDALFMILDKYDSDLSNKFKIKVKKIRDLSNDIRRNIRGKKVKEGMKKSAYNDFLMLTRLECDNLEELIIRDFIDNLELVYKIFE